FMSTPFEKGGVISPPFTKGGKGGLNGLLKERIMKRDSVYRSLLVLSLAVFPVGAAAQSPVNKPVLIIVPNAPGGGPDTIARLVAPRLSEALKQSVVVENRSSANGIVGTELAARAAADGSVIAMGNAG